MGEIREARGLIRLLRHRATPDGLEARIQDRLAHRETNFLRLIEDLVFAHPASPYRPLLDLAGYDLPRVTQLVHTRGLDSALDQLREDGVFIRIGEFKGVEPVVRQGHTFQFQPREFKNPTVRGVVQFSSSGSRSAGTLTHVGLEDFLHTAHFCSWLREQQEFTHRVTAMYVTCLFGYFASTVTNVMGSRPRLWFSMNGPLPGNMRWRIRLARLVTGRPFPLAQDVPVERIVEAARAIARLASRQPVLVWSFVNPALRLVLAAEEAGIHLGDVVFTVGGEPLTPTKRRQFEKRGYRVVSTYGFSEFGLVGASCLEGGREADDIHVRSDQVAVRRYSRAIDGDVVPAYLFTSLLSHTPNVILNMESGDYGGLEERACGCPLGRVGLTQHVHTIRSFEKLTAEGMTFFGSRLINLLEEVLPRTFGGDSRHYQLVESEDSQGLTRLCVLVSPALGPLDEDALRQTVLQEIAARHPSSRRSRLIREVWGDAGTLQVLRREPLTTRGGKILYLHRDRGLLATRGEMRS